MSYRIERWSGDPEPVSVALSAGFSDYPFPIRETPEAVRALVRIGYADPTASYVAWEAGRPVGAVLGVVRSDGRARVASMAIAPAHRRHGVGRQLLRAFLRGAVGAHAVHLEVLQDNARAIALYEAEGFVRTRALRAFRAALSRAPRTAGLRLGGLELLPRHGDLRPPRPLHRDRVAIERMPDVRVAVDTATGEWIAWREDLVLHIGGGAEHEVVRRLLGALPAEGFRLNDVPEDDPLGEALLALHWVLYASQWEMVRRAR